MLLGQFGGLMKGNNPPILSICIPTYMLANVIYEQVSKVLSFKGNFEVLICDNCSEDNTVELLSTIKDDRLRVIRNSENLGSLGNSLKVVSGVSGKYIMYLTDKDYLEMKYIEKILDYLEVNDFALGYFDLEVKEDCFEVYEYTDLCERFIKFAYLCKHPSGYIFNNKELQKLDIQKRFSNMEKVGGFAFEFIMAELSLKGAGVIFKVPFCYTKLPPFGGLKHSHTYSPEKNNIFFMPEQRLDIFSKFVHHLNTLKMPYGTRLKIMKNLSKRTYSFCIDEYKKNLEDDRICGWYNITAEMRGDVSIIELSSDFVKAIENADFYKNVVEKYIIVKKFQYKHKKLLKRSL